MLSPREGEKKQCQDDYPIADSATLAMQERLVIIRFEASRIINKENALMAN
jgi:hypothetical protein